VPTAGSEPNAAMAELWNGVSGENWLVHDELHDRALAAWGEAVLGAAAPGPGDRVIDVGCGTGAMTREAARRAAGGTALGVDISAPILARARGKAEAEGIGNVTFTVADAQVHPFAPASLDVAMSRFGVMFFDDPVAAFANVARALAPGGRLAFTCWAAVEENDWARLPAATMAAHVGPPNAAPGAPGPYSLADPPRVRAVLGDAGFTRVGITDAAHPMYLGADAGEAFAHVRSSGMTRALLDGKDPAAVDAALRALRDLCEGLDRGDGLTLPAKAWLVTATRI
jgi:SAM-dependent methyltransferase